MARGKRRAAIAPTVDMNESDSDKDSIDEHVAKRHARLQRQAQGSDSDSEPEGAGFGGEKETPVCDIDLSSSEDEEEDSDVEVLQKPSKANLEDESDNDMDDESHSEDDEGWRGRRGKNYGADTQEFEIMEDEERTAALDDEEEEARRLQDRSLSALKATDFVAEDDSDDDITGKAEELDAETVAKVPVSSLHDNAPELASLVQECDKYYGLVKEWKECAGWGDLAVTRFHLYASYAANIAFYFALLVDPDESRVDARTHPVVKTIVQLRQLVAAHETIEIKEPSPTEDGKMTDPPCTKEVEMDAGPKIAEHKVDNDSVVSKKIETKAERRARRKMKKERKRAKAAMVASTSVDIDDQDFVESLLQREKKVDQSEGKEEKAAKKRRQLNYITGALDSVAKNDLKRRTISVDADHIRAPDSRRAVVEMPEVNAEAGSGKNELDTLGDDDFVNQVLQKKERKETKKKSPAGPHHYSFKDKSNPNARRRASTQVVLNKGLARYRPKEKKTPRTKNKLAYASAVKRRKGMVRDAVSVKPGVSYAGEASGININARRGARLSDV